VYYNPGEDILEEVINRHSAMKTTLTEYFTACEMHEDARLLSYAEFPTKFVWNKKIKKWTPRKQGFAIGRVYFCGPKAGERFYLRMLLNKVKGAISYENLRTVEGVTHDTFQAACAALGLLQEDTEWDECLTEAAGYASGHQLRELFCIILLESQPLDPGQLWTAHRENLSDDCLYVVPI
jgi:hypothetical protein